MNRCHPFLQKKFVAAFLVLLLGLSILPVRHLHDLWASHHDEYSGCEHYAHHDGTCLYDASLVCKIHLLVVDLPYSFPPVCAMDQALLFFRTDYSLRATDPHIHFSILSDNRGPPSLIS